MIAKESKSQRVHEIVYIRCACIKGLHQIIREKTTVTITLVWMMIDQQDLFEEELFMSTFHLKGTDN